MKVRSKDQVIMLKLMCPQQLNWINWHKMDYFWRWILLLAIVIGSSFAGETTPEDHQLDHSPPKRNVEEGYRYESYSYKSNVESIDNNVKINIDTKVYNHQNNSSVVESKQQFSKSQRVKQHNKHALGLACLPGSCNFELEMLR